MRHNPAIEMRWFAHGKLWDSPEAAALARKSPPDREPRDRGWRPGGDHRDPRERFKRKKQPHKAHGINAARQSSARGNGGDRPSPPRGDRIGRPSPPPAGRSDQPTPRPLPSGRGPNARSFDRRPPRTPGAASDRPRTPPGAPFDRKDRPPTKRRDKPFAGGTHGAPRGGKSFGPAPSDRRTPPNIGFGHKPENRSKDKMFGPGGWRPRPDTRRSDSTRPLPPKGRGPRPSGQASQSDTDGRRRRGGSGSGEDH
jgi:hypothetical protein